MLRNILSVLMHSSFKLGYWKADYFMTNFRLIILAGIFSFSLVCIAQTIPFDSNDSLNLLRNQINQNTRAIESLDNETNTVEMRLTKIETMIELNQKTSENNFRLLLAMIPLSIGLLMEAIFRLFSAWASKKNS